MLQHDTAPNSDQDDDVLEEEADRSGSGVSINNEMEVCVEQQSAAGPSQRPNMVFCSNSIFASIYLSSRS